MILDWLYFRPYLAMPFIMAWSIILPLVITSWMEIYDRKINPLEYRQKPHFDIEEKIVLIGLPVLGFSLAFLMIRMAIQLKEFI